MECNKFPFQYSKALLLHSKIKEKIVFHKCYLARILCASQKVQKEASK